MFDRSKERIDDLCRGGLRIIQNSSAPCFAIDAVLLADFVISDKPDRIIDLGTGTGVIPLLVHVKSPYSRISGLELMPEMVDMARRSIALNELDSVLDIIAGDIRYASEILPRAEADIVTANPPYYSLDSGCVSEDLLFAAARSEVYCRLSQLLMTAAALLKPLGSFYGVQRGKRLMDMLYGLRQVGLEPVRLRMVQSFAESEANLFLVEAKKNCRAELKILPPLIIYRQRDIYSEEMQKIYQGR